MEKSGVIVPLPYVPLKPENADRKLREKLELIKAYAMIERVDMHLLIHGNKRAQDLELIKRLDEKII
ncbi:MAG: hypothetical protein GTN76_17105 [Candidatus Aenigmarchaeota archaeon]|nr:hypothetical protein [Candidatus Aenigmarchaeota archaeon]